MDKHNDILDQDDYRQGGRDTARRPRQAAPRLGSFVTIAVALLMLFGAASSIGKVPETAAIFGIDKGAEERITQELNRIRAAMTIGGVPVSASELNPPTGSLPVNPSAMPPPRPPVDPDTARIQSQQSRHLVSMPMQDPMPAPPSDPGVRPIAAPSQNLPSSGSHTAPATNADSQRPDTYVVANGDTWVKIAKRIYGDANRWRDIQDANPSARGGLEVGMKLRIPK